MTPDSGLSFGLFLPLVFGGVLYAVLLLAGAFLESRGDDKADTARDFAFACVLLTAVYAVVLAVITAVSKFGVIEDFVTIVLVVAVFFGLLAVVLLAGEMGVGALGRRWRRRRGG